MSPAQNIVATSVLSAVLVLGIAAPLVYFGLPMAMPSIGQQSNEVPSVVIDLKAELIEEIQTANDTTRTELSTQIQEVSAAQQVVLSELKATVEAIQAEQQNFGARLDTVETAPPPAAVVEVPGARPGAFNQTILFPLGKIEAKVIDVQLRDVTAKVLEHASKATCTTNVLGFSDTLGNDVSNLRLSQRRAEYVATVLRAAGLEISTVKGWGERWLDVHTLDGVKNPKNRRVVVEMLCGDGDPAQAPTT